MMGLDGVSVLIVEDDPVFRQLVGDYCRHQGMIVIEAEDGQDGLERFKQQRPDLILVDLCMPRMSGQELLAELAQIDANVPCIVITANKAMSDVVDALRHGAWDYLMKPLTDLQILRNAISDCLQESGAVEPSSDGRPQPQTTAATAAESSQQLSLAVSDNFDALRNDPQTAQMVQSQLFPAADWQGAHCRFSYNLVKTDLVSDRFCDGFQVDHNHYCAYLAKMSPTDTANAFVSVLIRSFFNQKLKRYRQGGSSAIIEPFTMLSYLNEQLVKSGLNSQIEIFYLALEQTSGRLSMARYGKQIKPYLQQQDNLSPLLLAESPVLGSASNMKPQSHFRSLSPGQSLLLLEGDELAKQQLLQRQRLGVQQGEHGGAALQLTLLS
ncbi:response regulator [Ferrimonas senticii]|uniref:response regulator n=1 Tax=Ferrimonas senticii TaxID=394566 RepID=UPI0003FE371D|nr:response regulator [Ferrimonas senticii]